MNSQVAASTIETIITIASRYVSVDGYYSRGREVNLRGTVVESGDDWRSVLSAELKALGYTLKVSQNGTVVNACVFPAQRRIPWLNIVLFVATAISVSIVPAWIIEGNRVFRDFSVILHWQKFAVPLLLILLFHEFGHYLAARRRGIRVSLPYFLPAPSAIGTFGAFIKSNSPFPSRRDLLEVGAYGPIAGFVAALAFLFLGLADVVIRPLPAGLDVPQLVEPLIMRLAQAIVIPASVPDGYSIFLQDNPMLFAAWVGLVVTMLNLLPVGQLDGGHIIYALSPRRHRLVSHGVFVALVGLGFVWQGWWIWAIMIFFVIRFGHPPTLNDYQPLERRSRWTGWVAMVIFLLTFSPVPF
jgi:Zn-dependent protease